MWVRALATTLHCCQVVLLHGVLPRYIAALRHCYMVVRESDSFLEVRSWGERTYCRMSSMTASRVMFAGSVLGSSLAPRTCDTVAASDKIPL